MEEKQCFKCGERKPLTEFYKHPEMADGRLNKCKPCARVDVRENRKKRVDYYRAYDRERGNRQTDEYRRRYREDNPIKYGARLMVRNAVRDGRLVKAKFCEECGAEGGLHGHHNDYAKPLDVRWLCPPCHFKWHGKHGEGKNAR